MQKNKKTENANENTSKMEPDALEVDVRKATIGAKMYSPFYNKTLQDSSNFLISNIKF